jgi:hypothetical protein
MNKIQMEIVTESIKSLSYSHYVAVAWAIAVIVMLVIILFKEKFSLMSSAPVMAQLPSSQLGIGSGSRYQQEFSSTSQGDSNIFARSSLLKQENLTGYEEPPHLTQSPNYGSYNVDMTPGENFSQTDKKLGELLHR